MPLHVSQYGDATRRPVNSALSGKALDFGAGDVAITLHGYSLGVKAGEWIRATPEQQAAALAQWASDLPSGKAKAGEPEAADYDTLSLADLKALAKTRGVDVSGKNSKMDIVGALHFADLQALNAIPAPVAGTDKDASLDLSKTTGE